MTTWRFEVVNRSDRPLGSVLPRPVKVGVRWFPLVPGQAGAGSSTRPVGNPLGPLPRVVPPRARTLVDVPVEVPAEPGRYEVRVALRQPGTGWFGVRVQGEVLVEAAGTAPPAQAEGSATRPTKRGAPVSTWRTA